VSKKKAVEARIAALSQGLPLSDNGREDMFELQHHHLLRCLERTTVRPMKSLCFSHLMFNLVTGPGQIFVARAGSGQPSLV